METIVETIIINLTKDLFHTVPVLNSNPRIITAAAKILNQTEDLFHTVQVLNLHPITAASAEKILNQAEDQFLMDLAPNSSPMTTIIMAAADGVTMLIQTKDLFLTVQVPNSIPPIEDLNQINLEIMATIQSHMAPALNSRLILPKTPQLNPAEVQSHMVPARNLRLLTVEILLQLKQLTNPVEVVSEILTNLEELLEIWKYKKA